MARENQTQPCLKAKLGCTYTDKKKWGHMKEREKIKGEREIREQVCVGLSETSGFSSTEHKSLSLQGVSDWHFAKTIC